jgi:hypothetical protein
VIALARAEFLKLRSTRTALGLLIALALLTFVPLIALVLALPRDWLETEGVSDLLGTATALVPIVLLVFGILGMTNEYRHGTITYSYLVTPRRWQVMVVKLAVYALVGMVTMLVAVVVVHLIIVAGSAVRGLDIDASGGRTPGDYARQIVVAGLITTFGVGLGALFRSQVLTVAGALIWSFVVESIVTVVKPAVGAWLPFVVFNQVSAGQMPGDSADPMMAAEMLARPEAFLVSIAYIAIVSVAAVFISLRRDVT